MSAPGFAFSRLIGEAKPAKVRELLDEDFLALVEALSPGIPNEAKLGALAAELLKPTETLSDPEMCEKVIRLLPLTKVRELASKLGITSNRNPYDDVASAAASAESLPVIFSFFGVVDEARAPTTPAPTGATASASYALFDHQRRAASATTEMLSADPRKGVLHMPTGAGKTRTAMHVVAAHLIRNEPTVVCWLAQNVELLDQAADEFEKAWNSLGNRDVDIIRFWGDRRPDLLSIRDGIVISGLGKMASLDKRYPQTLLALADRTSLVIMDEAHQAIAPTYESVLTALFTKRRRNALLGLTATPGRTWSDVREDERLAEFFGGRKVTLEVEGYDDPVSFLIQEGYLARPRFETLNSGSGLELSEGDVADLARSIDVPSGLLDRLGTDVQRNLKIIGAVEQLMTRHRRVIIFAPSVASARMLSAILVSRNHEALVVTGETNRTERERTIRRFRSSVHHPIALFNFGVLTTGFDAPATSAAVIARPTKSLVLYSQMVGRATRGRRAGGNDEAEIVTVVDPHLPGFGDIAAAFQNWEDVWSEPRSD